MSTTTISQEVPCGSTERFSCVEDVEVWVESVLQVLRTSAGSGGSTGPGSRSPLEVWAPAVHRALDLVEHELCEAQDHGLPCHDLEWLHTRVSIVLDATTPAAQLPRVA